MSGVLFPSHALLARVRFISILSTWSDFPWFRSPCLQPCSCTFALVSFSTTVWRTWDMYNADCSLHGHFLLVPHYDCLFQHCHICMLLVPLPVNGDRVILHIISSIYLRTGSFFTVCIAFSISITYRYDYLYAFSNIISPLYRHITASDADTQQVRATHLDHNQIII